VKQRGSVSTSWRQQPGIGYFSSLDRVRRAECVRTLLRLLAATHVRARPRWVSCHRSAGRPPRRRRARSAHRVPGTTQTCRSRARDHRGTRDAARCSSRPWYLVGASLPIGARWCTTSTPPRCAFHSSAVLSGCQSSGASILAICLRQPHLSSSLRLGSRADTPRYEERAKQSLDARCEHGCRDPHRPVLCRKASASRRCA
jgi:hypothetical protein